MSMVVGGLGSMVVGGLGSSRKMHRRRRKMAQASLKSGAGAFQREIKKARKNKKHCKAAASALVHMAMAAGVAHAEAVGARRKKSKKKSTSAGLSRAKHAAKTFAKVCVK